MRRIQLPSTHVYYNKNFTYVDELFFLLLYLIKKLKVITEVNPTVMHTTVLQVVKENSRFDCD
jgi:hypothetical protein